MNILDIDLDFFLYGRETFAQDSYNNRANALLPWEKEDVVAFLENKMGLSRTSKIPGCCITNHHEVYFEWKKLIEHGGLSCPFTVFHIDAHADLGLGDSSWSYLSRVISSMPLSERITPKIGGDGGLTFANYLSFAIANQWISNLTFIINKNWSDDIVPSLLTKSSFDYWRKCDQKYGSHEMEIQLKKISDADQKDILYCGKQFHDLAKSTSEPIVPFNIRNIETIEQEYSKIRWDYVFLAKSPGYTPSSADYLIDVISDYIDNDTYD